MRAKLVLLPLAGLGMLLGHELGYRAVEHDAGHRHELLQSTGHSWLALEGPLLLLLATLAIAGGLNYVVKGTQAPKLWQILSVQIGLFWAVEFLERALSGHPAIPHVSILALGALAQIPASALVWLIYTRIVLPSLALLDLPPAWSLATARQAQLQLPSRPAGKRDAVLEHILGRAPPVAG